LCPLHLIRGEGKRPPCAAWHCARSLSADPLGAAGPKPTPSEVASCTGSRLLCYSLASLASPFPPRAFPPKTPCHSTPWGGIAWRSSHHLPGGEWSGLVEIRSVDGHYEGTFSNPDGPGTYPVASVKVSGNVLTITMAGEATGSVFRLTVMGDSLVGDMTSLTNGLTQVKGKRLKP
jgi:hypothetical protein